MKGVFYFNGKVNVIWGINDVYDIILFFLFLGCFCCSRSNSDIMFLFLFYLVYGSCIIVYFVNFVVKAGVEKDMFGSSCFIGIDVCGNINIFSVFKIFLCYDYFLKGIFELLKSIKKDYMWKWVNVWLDFVIWCVFFLCLIVVFFFLFVVISLVVSFFVIFLLFC